MSETKKAYVLKFTSDELAAVDHGKISEAVVAKMKQLKREAERDNFDARVRCTLKHIYQLTTTNGNELECDLNELAIRAATDGRRLDRVFVPGPLFSTMCHGLGVPQLSDQFTLATPTGYISVYRHSASGIEGHCA